MYKRQEGVLLQTAIEMAHLMAEGRSVKIDGIGTFTPSLTLGRDKEREDPEEGGTHRNAQSIFIGGVNFRVDLSLIHIFYSAVVRFLSQPKAITSSLLLPHRKSL